MSLIIFELKEQHVLLLKHLKWSINKENIIVSVEDKEELIPFGLNSIYEAMDLILNGRSDRFYTNEEEFAVISDEEKAAWDKLYQELPLALEVVLYNGHFELGTYKAKFHDRVWKKK